MLHVLVNVEENLFEPCTGVVESAIFLFFSFVYFEVVRVVLLSTDPAPATTVAGNCFWKSNQISSNAARRKLLLDHAHLQSKNNNAKHAAGTINGYACFGSSLA
jgi:uracil DNA glycosylase